MSQLPKQTTLCFLTRENSVLLAMKKRGFGTGKWNGVGGKLLPGESPEAAVIREAEEEISATPTGLKKVALISFVFPAEKSDWNQECHIYLSQKWSGEPVESEEMAPQWFAKDSLPFAQMWPDDPLWLPLVLSDKKLKATFRFDAEQQMLPGYAVTQVNHL